MVPEGMSKVNFSNLAIGQEVVVKDLERLEPLLRRRLNSLGFIEGIRCYVHNRSIFGGPLTITYNKQVISLRRRDAELIGVEMA